MILRILILLIVSSIKNHFIFTVFYNYLQASTDSFLSLRMTREMYRKKMI